MLFRKNYEIYVKAFEEMISVYGDALNQTLSDYVENEELGFLIYPLLHETADLACWNSKFKGKNEFKERERAFVKKYSEATGRGEHYIKMKKMYNDAVGFGKMSACVHVDEQGLVDGFDNMLLRGALVLTQVLYGIDISENNNQEKMYYTDLTNQVYITIYQFYEQLFTLLSEK